MGEPAVGPFTGDFNAKRWKPNRRDGGRGKRRPFRQAGSVGAGRELRFGNRRTDRDVFGDVKAALEAALTRYAGEHACFALWIAVRA